LIVVAFLVPLAIYCLVLGLINRRRRPLMVSAAWDFVGLLVAASGFLLFGLPGLLSGFTEHGRRVAMFGRAPQGNGGATAWFWDLFEGLCSTLFEVGSGGVLMTYFVVVVAACALTLWRRQGQTAVYNVHPDVFDEVLAGVLDAAGLVWSRAGSRYFIRRPAPGRKPVAVSADEGVEPAPPLAVREHLPPGPGRGDYPASAEDFEQSAYLEVDAAPALCHVTLRWDAEDKELRQVVEAELAPALAEVRTRHNPAAFWLLTAGSLMLSAAVLTFVFVVLRRLFVER
jgi:hypothetical protein